MSAGNPKVSVCLMTYNGAATVERALTTLLAQTHHDYELVISDDHSTDDTLAICEHLTSGHPQVRFIRPEYNLGAYGNMRFALSQARGKYFVWACQDDYWEPEFLERLVDALEQSPGAIGAQGRVLRVSQDGAISEEVRLSGRDLPEKQSRLGLAASILIWRTHRWGVFIHGIWERVVLAAAYEAHGSAPSDERQILCQLALAGGFRYVDQLLFHKTVSGVPLHKRRSATDATVLAREKHDRRAALRQTLAAVSRSPLISPVMKRIAPSALLAARWWHDMRRRGQAETVVTLRRLLPASAFDSVQRLYQKLRSGVRKETGFLRKKY